MYIGETIFIAYVNNKKIKELAQPVKDMIYKLFEVVDEDNVVRCDNKGLAATGKPDVYIEINNKRKYISLKDGGGNSVHQERIETFTSFLKHLGWSNIAIDLLKEFHFADGTKNNSGNKRYNNREYKTQNPVEYNSLVDYIKQNNKTILPILRRVIISGAEDSCDVDAVFHGTSFDNALWATSEEVLEYLSNVQRNNNLALYFGGLSYQVWNRCLNGNPSTQERRMSMQLKWGNLQSDLAIMRSMYDISKR